jgi:stress-induced morphogen
MFKIIFSYLSQFSFLFILIEPVDEDEHQFIPVDDSINETQEINNSFGGFTRFDIVELNDGTEGGVERYSESVIVPHSSIKNVQQDVVIKTEPEDIEIDNKEEAEINIKEEEAEEEMEDDFNPASSWLEIDETSSDILKMKPPIVNQQKQNGDNKKEEGHLKCEICDKTFKYRKSYKQHRLDHKVKNDMLSCKICGKLLKPSAMDYHMNYR